MAWRGGFCVMRFRLPSVAQPVCAGLEGGCPGGIPGRQPPGRAPAGAGARHRAGCRSALRFVRALPTGARSGAWLNCACTCSGPRGERSKASSMRHRACRGSCASCWRSACCCGVSSRCSLTCNGMNSWPWRIGTSVCQVVCRLPFSSVPVCCRLLMAWLCRREMAAAARRSSCCRSPSSSMALSRREGRGNAPGCGLGLTRSSMPSALRDRHSN